MKVAEAIELWVEGYIADNSASRALQVAEEELAQIERSTDRKGIAIVMGAVARAMAARSGEKAGLAKMKEFVETVRESGNKSDEAVMLHKLAVMVPNDEEALNFAQVALDLAQTSGNAKEEEAIKYTLDQLLGARGKHDKAPHRKEALAVLATLSRELEAKNGEQVDEALKRLKKLWPTLKQHDFDKAINKAVEENPASYKAFLKEHHLVEEGEDDDEQSGGPSAKGSKLNKNGISYGQNKWYECPKLNNYFSFRGGGGIGYGPRFRVCDIGGGFNDDQGMGVMYLQDCHEDWEFESQYCPPIIDSQFHSSMAGNVARSLRGIDINDY